jgi:acyl transferase domain-containing protein
MIERRNLLQESLVAIERLQAKLEASERALHQPIAIIGAGCRFPGGIETLEALWHVVRDGIDAVADVPADRWDIDAYYDPDPKAHGKMVTRRGGFLSQVDRFDPQFFGISPREATTMDPQQRLLLETAYEALESAGIATDRLGGSLTGVFVGISTCDYAQLLQLGGAENFDVYSATGSALNAGAGRISYTFGLQGPCVSMDTACSSSLVAVHMACQSLRTGESNLALASGVNVVLSPDAMVLFSKWGMMAPDGACKTFDAAADGFVRAEGCAVIALKRLSDALAANDPILAVIRGSAVNSDGRSSGLTVPNGPAQQAVLRAALASARLQPSDIDYVEAHGTGTSLGDPIEVEAIGAVMREGRPAGRPLSIGSIKTNLGHTESVSGLAGLLKVVAALQHEAIPPHLHFSTPNPGIPWSELPITVPTTLTAWPRGAVPRRSGVSSFGFSGTNAHVIVEEAPPRAAAAQSATGPYLVPLSARDDGALRAMGQRLADFLASDAAPALPDVAATLATGRAHFQRRVAFIADSSTDLARDLSAIEAEPTSAMAEVGVRAGQQPKIAFLFTGQGAQYAGMGRRLYETEPVFRAVLGQAAAVLAPVLARPLLEVLFQTDEFDATLSQTAYTQPALFTIEYALAQLWRSWGIIPSVVAGHSVGEYVAACVAGVFSFEDGLRLIAERARLMQALPAGGGMAAIFADEARVAPSVAALGDRLSIAALNGPEEIVVAGDNAALAKLVDEFALLGVNSKLLDVSHAFHSHRLDSMLDALERRAAAVPHAAPRISLISNLTGTLFAPGTGPDARYWRRHAREPVRFSAGIAALRDTGVTALVEVGPHPALLALLARAVPDAPWSATPSLRRGRDDRREMLTGVASLYVRGAPVRWDALIGAQGGRRISLPTYPFQRERYWVTAARPSAPAAGSQAQPLPDQPHARAAEPATSLTLPLLRVMAPEARNGALQTYLRVQAARVLGFVPERLDTSTPLSSFGFDSLMAVQLKNRIEADIGGVVPMSQFLQGPSIEQLVCPVLEAAEALDRIPAIANGAAEVWEEGSL